MAKKALIPEAMKKKRSELFEVDGTLFRVVFAPNAALNRLENWVEKLRKREAKATTFEYATELHHTGKLPSKFVPETEAVEKYIDFIKVCLLYTTREMMEKAIRSAPKKKDGTLMGRRVQHLAFTGLAVNFTFYELCAVNETDNVIELEIRSTDCSSKYLPVFAECKTCAEILAENAGLLPKNIAETTTQAKKDVQEAASVPAEIKSQFLLKNDPAGFVIDKCKNRGYEVIIPQNVGGKPVLGIGSYAFLDLPLHMVTVPGTVKKIANGVFKNCKNLSAASLEEGIEQLGPAAFAGCIKLSSIQLPDSIKTIAQNAFADCFALTDIKLPANLKKISQNMFLNCKALRSICVPEGVTDIQSTAFDGCINLEEIVIPASVTNIHNAAFLRCEKLVICAPKGSFAEKFAKSKNMQYREI